MDRARRSDAPVRSRVATPTVCGHRHRHMGYPTPVGRRTLRRVARPAQHGGVDDVERGTASSERYDVINGQIRGSVGRTLVAEAPVSVLTTPGAEHAGAQTLPGARAVEGVVPTAVRLLGVRGAAAPSAARQHAADGAELHNSLRLVAVPLLTLVTLDCLPVAIAMSVVEAGAAVYSPVVLHLEASVPRTGWS
jgi:hypothetical protein